jgi:hypothetical protein
MREGAPVNDFGKLDVIARRAFATPDEAISCFNGEIASTEEHRLAKTWYWQRNKKRG